MSAIATLPPVFFDHVHKAAGTSVQTLLATLCGPENVARADSPTEIALREYEKVRVIVGHMTHSAGCWPFLQRYTFTVLRDPITRALSYYYFCRHIGSFAASHGRRKQRSPSEVSFDEFISEENEDSDLVTNFQTRHFAALGVEPRSDPLKSAKAALERYHLVGMHESLNDSIRLLLADLQYTTEIPIPAENVTPRYPGPDEIPASLRQAIEDKNSLDLELLSWARERFRERLALPPARVIVLSKASPMPDSPLPEISAETEVILVGATLSACDGRESNFATGEHVTLTAEIWSEQDLPGVTVGFSILATFRRQVYGTNTYHLNHSIDLKACETNEIRFELPLLLAPGRYSVGLSCHRGSDTTRGVFLWREAVISFEVTNPWLPAFIGAIYLPTTACAGPISRRTPGRWMAPLSKDHVHVRIDVPQSYSSGKLRACSGQIVEVPVQVTNLSTHPLTSFQPFPVVLSYHVKAPDGSIVLFDGKRTIFPAPVLPASHVDMIAFIEAPSSAGVYAIEITLVQEGRFWFDGLQGGLPRTIELTVNEEEILNPA